MFGRVNISSEFCLYVAIIFASFGFSLVASDIREIGPLWEKNSGRPPQSGIAPGADRSEVTVVSSFPVAIVDRGIRDEIRLRRLASHVHRLERQYSRTEPFTPTARDVPSDPVLEKYPGLPNLWTPYTEDPSTLRANRKRPLFIPDRGFLLEQ